MLIMTDKRQGKTYQPCAERKDISATIKLSLIFLLIAASCAKASPTTTKWDLSIFKHTGFSETKNTPGLIASADSRLARIGSEIVKPYIAAQTLSVSPAANIKSLPAVPAAMLMVLTGFICVSLIRDRRIWMTVMLSVLCVGYAGIHAVPKLALHLGHKTNALQYPYSAAAKFYLPQNNNRERCDIEGTRYIGLLNHLAGIPCRNNIIVAAYCQTNHLRTFSQTHNSKIPQFALTNLSFLTAITTSHLMRIARRFICFSPAFIFDNLSRGPPLISWI